MNFIKIVASTSMAIGLAFTAVPEAKAIHSSTLAKMQEAKDTLNPVTDITQVDYCVRVVADEPESLEDYLSRALDPSGTYIVSYTHGLAMEIRRMQGRAVIAYIRRLDSQGFEVCGIKKTG